MTYNKLLNINKSKARKEVIKIFGESFTENSAYHKIYDMSEKEFRLEFVTLDDFIKNIIIKAEFAEMPEAEILKEAFDHFNANEGLFNSLF